MQTNYHQVAIVTNRDGLLVPVFVGESGGRVTGLTTASAKDLHRSTGGTPLSEAELNKTYANLCLTNSPRGTDMADFGPYAARLAAIKNNTADWHDDCIGKSTVVLATDGRRALPVDIDTLKVTLYHGYVRIVYGAIALADAGNYEQVDQRLASASRYAAREEIAEGDETIKKLIRASAYNAAYAKHVKNAEAILAHLLDRPFTLETLTARMQNFTSELEHIEEVERRAKENGIELEANAKAKARVAALNREVERLQATYARDVDIILDHVDSAARDVEGILDQVDSAAEQWLKKMEGFLSGIFSGTRR